MSHTKPIKLGRSLTEMIMPAMPRETDYPRLHLDDIEDERLADLPVGKEGTAEIRFKVVTKEQREDQGEKKNRKRYSVVLEIISIEPGHDPRFNGKAKISFMDSARDGFKKNFK